MFTMAPASTAVTCVRPRIARPAPKTSVPTTGHRFRDGSRRNSMWRQMCNRFGKHFGKGLALLLLVAIVASVSFLTPPLPVSKWKVPNALLTQFSPDGRFLITRDGNVWGSPIRLWDVNGGVEHIDFALPPERA